MTFFRKLALILTLLLSLGAAACGGSTDLDSATANSDTSASPATTDLQPAPVDGRVCITGGSIEFNSAIGWKVTGPDGAVVKIVETMTTANGSLDQSNTYTLAGPREMLYTGFVLETSVSFTVESGGPVQVDSFYGNVVKDGEFGEYTITEELESVEVADSETTVLTATTPCP